MLEYNPISGRPRKWLARLDRAILGISQRNVPQWLRTELRIGQLPGYNERMVRTFLKAGYNVVPVNCLGTWDRVGPSASMYSSSHGRHSIYQKLAALPEDFELPLASGGAAVEVVVPKLLMHSMVVFE